MQDQVAALAELGVRAAFLNSTLTGAQAARSKRGCAAVSSISSTSRPSGC